MVLGTSSHVGKSLLTAALCRIFARAGVNVAPFKSQNMSLNSAATIEGLEIGRAQALQAEAACTPASVHMNPILLKPSGDMSSQVVVRGKIWGQISARDYHLRRVEELMPLVRESYETLAARHDLIVLEGAGSPAEINLKEHDIVNMRMAELADASCILVGDIDRGGVFASLYGTVELLEPHEQARICGFLINKFRGDVTLLEPGIRMIEERLGKPCLGVVPWLHDLTLEEEDSLSISERRDSAFPQDQTSERKLRIAVIALPTFSNFTDFDSLRAEPSVSLRFTRRIEHIAKADLVILPGSKQTVDDLNWLQAQGIAEALLAYAKAGLIVGICGGMQMLGEQIHDPDGMEHRGVVRALGLLPIRTTMQPQKITTLTSGRLSTALLFGQRMPETTITGYEIHIGETAYLEGAQSFATLSRQILDGDTKLEDGCIAHDTRIFGTYLHGLFDDDTFRHAFLAAARTHHALSPASHYESWKQSREDSLNRLADEVAKALDLPHLFALAGQTKYITEIVTNMEPTP